MTAARQWAIDGMQSCLPKGCLLPFITVESAKFIKKNVVLAHVKMFDGFPGTLQISQVSYCDGAFSGWSLHWQDLPGGAINWNGESWERHVKLEQLELV